jgi:hypothetical protein
MLGRHNHHGHHPHNRPGNNPFAPGFPSFPVPSFPTPSFPVTPNPWDQRRHEHHHRPQTSFNIEIGWPHRAVVPIMPPIPTIPRLIPFPVTLRNPSKFEVIISMVVLLIIIGIIVGLIFGLKANAHAPSPPPIPKKEETSELLRP